MKRRKLLLYGALGSASFLINNHSLLSANMTSKKNYEWIILYWMPYDNDLSRFGKPIMEMLAKGVQTDNILVVVQSDFRAAKQLTRNMITPGTITSENLDNSNSASEEVFAEYLNWAKSQFQAKKWAIIFLGHGGVVDEISPDNHPELSVFETRWMNIKKLCEIIVEFNKAVDRRVELIFFQNCNKGTIETHYTFRDPAKYTLSSQLLLGAPNYYYESLFNYLGRHPDIGGAQMAEKIMEFEREDMFHSYTVTSNQAIHNLPAKLNPLIDSIISSDWQDIKMNKIKTYSYFGNSYADIIQFFDKVSQASGADRQKYQIFSDYLKNSIIHRVRQKGTLLGRDIKPDDNFCGLGIFLPKNRQEFKKYRDLPIYSEVKLLELFESFMWK
jgi:hypothetical protein